MDSQKIKQFSIMGIAVRTTNENGQSSEDIPALWNRFMSEGIAAKIPHKIDDTIFSIYTDYENDHTQPYTTILACKVAHLNHIPDGLVGKVIKEGSYIKHTAKGNLLKGVVFEEWTKIWNSAIPRAYTQILRYMERKRKIRRRLKWKFF